MDVDSSCFEFPSGKGYTRFISGRKGKSRLLPECLNAILILLAVLEPSMGGPGATRLPKLEMEKAFSR
jgi:hypothetical protein